MPKIELIQGDCLEKMKDIPDKSIDMILCDLPYGTTACKWDAVIPFNKYVQIGEKVIYEQEYVFDKMKSGVSYKEALEDFLSISKDGLWDNYKRIIKDRGAIVLFGSEPFSSYLRMSNIKQYKYDWVWKKTKAGNFIQANYQPIKYHEIISVFSDSPASFTKTGNAMMYYPQMWGSTTAKNNGQSIQTAVAANRGKFSNKYVLKSTNDTGKRFPISLLEYANLDKIHPTQKPVALLEYLIKTYTLEGETVLDNCMGSGSTGVACKNLNRNFIGIELDPEYFKIAEKRINENL